MQKELKRTEVESKADNNDYQALVNLLEKNLAVNEEVFRLTKKLHAAMIFNQVMFWVKLVLILIPLVAASIFLPPLLQEVIGSYQAVLR